jgi:hypothetical protein
MTNRPLMAVIASIALLELLPASEPRGSTRFSEHLIADGYGYAFGLAAADLDGDGDLDVTSVDIRGKPSMSSLFWFENDGHGKFRRHTVHKDEPGWFERHAVGDIDGDRRPDVAVVNNRDGHILWFANQRRPADGLWKRHVVTTKCTRAYDVALADLDSDGDVDAAAAGYASNRFTWYENPGKGRSDQEWTECLIDEKMSEARTIRLGDFNGDGKLDLLGAAAGAENVPLNVLDSKHHAASVVWYENPGQPASLPWKKHIIDDATRAPIHGHAIDMDADRDLDVVMAHGMRQALVPADKHEVVWYENMGRPGSGLQWTKHQISPLPYAFEAFAADLDTDGDIDVVATAWAKGDRIVWFENHGNARDKWTQHVVKASWPAANQVIVADLNGDRRPDILATADNGSSRVQGANELRWWRNEGKR